MKKALLLMTLVGGLSAGGWGAGATKPLEDAWARPCEKNCNVNHWFDIRTGSSGTYCYPQGEWRCPLYSVKDD